MNSYLFYRPFIVRFQERLAKQPDEEDDQEVYAGATSGVPQDQPQDIYDDAQTQQEVYADATSAQDDVYDEAVSAQSVYDDIQNTDASVRSAPPPAVPAPRAEPPPQPEPEQDVEELEDEAENLYSVGENCVALLL